MPDNLSSTASTKCLAGGVGSAVAEMEDSGQCLLSQTHIPLAITTTRIFKAFPSHSLLDCHNKDVAWAIKVKWRIYKNIGSKS